MIKKMKHYNNRMTTVLNELEHLEDGSIDYTDMVGIYAELVRGLEHRREVLQRKGRTQ